ncbi:MAG: hypothetical protein HY590_07110 [Candidatus Omnitrophica bacterium]|nr:hypothetical protein [Candidatus Omnitrophota bacterium]
MEKIQKANWLHELLLTLPAARQRELLRSVRKISHKERILYEKHRGGHKVIPLFVRPRLLKPFQLRYCRGIILELQKAIQIIYNHYFEEPLFQEILPFPEIEKEHFIRFYQAQGRAQTVMSRWDAVSDYSGANWKKYLRFVEWNGVGIGGLYYAIAAQTIMQKALFPLLKELKPNFRLVKMVDSRELLYRQILRHAKKVGIRLKRVGLVEELRELGGPLEFEEFRDYFKKRGLDAVLSDPRDLSLNKGKILARGKVVEMIYRDSELEEILDMEKHGDDMRAFKEAFRRNAVLSSLMGEFDHKSALEVLTRPDLARYFTPRQRNIFRFHAVWTRLLRPIFTTGPDGKRIDLYAYARRKRETSVIKPNREFGGKGVTFGKNLSQREWERSLEKAFRHPSGWVIQEQAENRQKKFITSRRRKLQEESLNVVDGHIVTPDGISIIGRGSRLEVVNVARQGGLVATLVYR